MSQDLQALRDHKDPVDAPSLDPRDLQESEDRKETQVNKELRGSLVDLEVWEEKDQQEPEGSQVKTGHQADRVLQEPSDPRELQGLQDSPDLQGNRGSWDHRVHLEAKGRKGNGATSSPRLRFRPSPGRSVSSSFRATWRATTPS